MASDVEKLLEKYWNGETTVDEEKQIKKHFASQHNISPQAKYFTEISNRKEVKAGIRFRTNRFNQISVAASVAVGLLVAFFVFKDAQQKDAFVVEDPQEALEITRNALMMVSSGLNEGKSYSLELDKINKAKSTLANEKD